MNEKTPIVNFTNVTILMATLGFGFALIRGNLESPRPAPLEASHIPDTADVHKVESRLWQDPFEPFESATNKAASAKAPKSEIGAARQNLQPENPAPPEVQQPWKGINDRVSKPGSAVKILGVMLEGSSYAEDKEVRLRTRYAVELALSTAEAGPEDRIHIFTNSVRLFCPEEARDSKFAYEWFVNETGIQFCVLWLNEYDFSPNPMLELGSLLTNIPALASKDATINISFNLIGPRSSDTLRSLAEFNGGSQEECFQYLKTAAKLNRFHILSPEATTSVDPTNEDLYGPKLVERFESIFEKDVFANWITPDQTLADLLAQELANRVDSTDGQSNVVVLLAEQDTYYGRELADEWIDALTRTNSGVCASQNDIWQFAYLRGLDGSKAAKERTSSDSSQEKARDVADSPEAALQPLLQQQHRGFKADGNAQLDYIVRLGEFLKTKDKWLRQQKKSRILAVGLTGSDAYDKLTLLRELRDDLPDAVFFTTDLDAPLWTASELVYTRNLLVASAYPLDPNPEFNSPPLMQQFPPFRDVYQAAVFRACNSLVQTGDPLQVNDPAHMSGGLYKIGRSGPVPLDSVAPSGDSGFPLASFLFLLFLCVLAVILKANATAGFREPNAPKIPSDSTGRIERAKFDEQEKQFSFWALGIAAAMAAVIGLACWGFAAWTKSIASLPGQEPWDFHGGVSIWTSEWIRFFDILAGGIFFWIAMWSRRTHRRKLWEKYFREKEPATGDWNSFWDKCRRRWNSKLDEGQKNKFIEEDALDLCKKSGQPDDKQPGYVPQAAADFEREQKIVFGLPWLPPFVASKDGGQDRACINAFALFRSYLRAGRFRIRIWRILGGVILYAVSLGLLMACLGDIPRQVFIRGADSRGFDIFCVITAFFTFLFALFYVLDGTVLTSRFLNCISRFPTRWPDRLLRETEEKFGVDACFLDGFLDVDFAAYQTKEVGTLMLGPIVILLILAISRSRYLDNWPWPPVLIVCYAVNFLVAGACWWIVRRAADKVRQAALDELADSIAEVANSKAKNYGTPARPRAAYLKRLRAVQRAIQEEHRGAYAHAFQDPTYLAVFLPSGATGAASLIASWFLKK
ncbi:MAG TPA: hypothetical protein VGO59_17400 [Verrucomicrobiae bacterium]|jgi:hypothetical protein